MLFCCEQAFHGAVDAFERVFRHRLSADTLEKISQWMGADQFPPFVPPLRTAIPLAWPHWLD